MHDTKEKHKKGLSELGRLSLIATLVGVASVLLSLIGLAFKEPGWVIGTAIGAVLEVPCVVLLFVGADFVIKKNSLPPFILFYLLRMLLFAGGLVLTAVLDYVLQIPAFHHSIFGVLIGYTPMQFIVIGLILHDDGEKKLKKSLPGEKDHHA